MSINTINRSWNVFSKTFQFEHRTYFADLNNFIWDDPSPSIWYPPISNLEIFYKF